MRDILPVVVDGLWRQWRRKPGRSSGERRGATVLPAWTPGAHIDLHLPLRADPSVLPDRQPGRTGSLFVSASPASRSLAVAPVIFMTPRAGTAIDDLCPAQPLLFRCTRAAMWCFSPPGSVLRRCWRWPTPGRRPAPALRCTITASRAQEAAFATEIARQLTGGICQIHCSDEGQSPRQRLAQDPGLRTPTPGVYFCGPPRIYGLGLKIPRGRSGWGRGAIAQRSVPAARPDGGGRNLHHHPRLPPGSAGRCRGTKTIAQALQEHGVAVPASCEMGICGACLTPVREGTVDHRDTVQSEVENRPQSSILRCVALQPVGPI